MKNVLIVLAMTLSFNVYSQSERPVIILDNIALDPSTDMFEVIDITQIATIIVIQPCDAIEKYGDYIGKTGVVLVESKLPTFTSYPVPDDMRLKYGDMKPVYVMDDKVIDQKKADIINPTYIKSIEVSKGLEQVKKYGPQALNGVIRISTAE